MGMPARGLELKVPPVALVLVTGTLMWLGARSVPHPSLAAPGRSFLAGGLALSGTLVSVLGVVSFRRARTTVNPMEPGSTSSLVVSGIYGVTRNPMYLGFLLLLLGWATWLSSALAFLPLPLFCAYMNAFQIGPEERALGQLFGERFAAYRGKVRRWI